MEDIEVEVLEYGENAFVYLGKAKQLIKKYGLDEDIIEQMVAGNYDQLIEVFNKHFAKYCTIS